jgi:Leu/Phe-tRNA-protein transferase
MRDDDDSPFHYPAGFYESVTDPWPPSRETQECALFDIQVQFVECMERAVQDPDPWVAIKIMVNAERILDAYARGRFVMLAPVRDELRADLHKVWRMERRRFIRRALLSPADEFPRYLAAARDPKLGLDGPDADADFDAVVRHLEQGGPLYGDLRKRAN